MLSFKLFENSLLASISVILCCIALIDAIPRPGKEWGLTPIGWGHSSCVHIVQNGAHVRRIEPTDGSSSYKVENPDGSSEILPRCHFQFQSAFEQTESEFEGGWQVWSTYQSPTSFDSFLGLFTIPDTPQTYVSQTLFMFTGLQNFNWIPGPDQPTPPDQFEIIQPVLQYGPSAAGGGEFWTLASWYVTIDAGYIVSNLSQVASGDVVFGNMTLLDPDTWFIYGRTMTGGVVTQITVDRPRLVSNPWAYCTLEVYDNAGECSQYPTIPQVYSKLFLTSNKKQVIPQWTANITVSPICGEHTTIESPQQVTLHFGSA